MWGILHLGLQELKTRWKMTLAMALTLSVSLAGFLLLNAYHEGLVSRYSPLAGSFLVVEQTGSMGEFYGSRLPAAMQTGLSAAGASLVIPEIHSVVGTSPDNAVLLRGIDLKQYGQVERFQMVEGRPLQPGDSPRLAMVGVRLAEQRNALPGGVVQVRGREFNVVGVFAIGTYADYEVWISLEDAQTLLGWDQEVSIFVVPEGEKLKAGDLLPGGASVIQKGESGVNLIQEWEPMFDLMGLVAALLGVAAAAALANMLWRLAWVRRHDLAILQSIGFGRPALILYLLVQSAGVTLLGFTLGAAAAVILGSFTQIATAGISIHALFDAKTLGASLLFACLVTAAGTVLPAWWISRLNLATLLRQE
jgi:ABC-type lipoprotein release transport system permease subunit